MEYVLVNGELYHHGIKGMKWGIRRYQNEDGSLTAAGRVRYGPTGEAYLRAKSDRKEANRAYNKAFDKAYSKNYQIYSLNKRKREEKSKDWDNAYDRAADWRKANERYKNEKKKVQAYQNQMLKDYARVIKENEIKRGQKLTKKGKNVRNRVFSHIGKTLVGNIAIAGTGAVAVGLAAVKMPSLVKPITTLTTAALYSNVWNRRIKDGRDVVDILLYRHS